MRTTPASKTSQALGTPDCPSNMLLFMVLVGVFFFITVIKFGIPVILDAESTRLDAMFGGSSYSWPVKWGYLLMVPVFAAGLFAIRWTGLPGKGAGCCSCLRFGSAGNSFPPPPVSRPN